jgi:hypothetical protein
MDASVAVKRLNYATRPRRERHCPPWRALEVTVITPVTWMFTRPEGMAYPELSAYEELIQEFAAKGARPGR